MRRLNSHNKQIDIRLLYDSGAMQNREKSIYLNINSFSVIDSSYKRPNGPQ